MAAYPEYSINMTKPLKVDAEGSPIQTAENMSGSQLPAAPQNLGFTPYQPAAGFTPSPVAPASASGGQPVAWNGYTPTMAAPVSNVSSSNITGQKTDLTNTFAGMGGLDPTKAYQSMLTGEVNNPYLDQQAGAIRTDMTRNLLENVMPGIGQNATAMGQYGGSRQGIAQGLGISRMNQDMSGALANLYGNAYESAQTRMGQAAGQLGSIGSTVAESNANRMMQADLSNQSSSLAAQVANAQAANQANLANAGFANQAGQANALGQFNANQFNAGQAQNLGLANAGFQNQANLANQAGQLQAGLANQSQQNQVGLANQGNQIQYNLGMGQNQNQATANANALTNYQNQFTLGKEQNANTAAQLQNQMQNQAASSSAAAYSQQLASQRQQEANQLAREQLGFNMQNTGLLTWDTLNTSAIKNGTVLPNWIQSALQAQNSMYNNSAGQGVNSTGTTTAPSNPLLSGIGAGTALYNQLNQGS